MRSDAAPSTWNRNRAAVDSWLAWCHTVKRWPAPGLPADCERRAERADHTHDLPKRAIDRQLSRRDIPLREKTLWRMLYETAARASEILARDVEQLDLANRRAPVRSKGGQTEWVHWGTGTAHLLPRLLRLPDGTSRTSGPLFLANRKPTPLANPRPATSARTPGDPGSDTTAPAPCYTPTPAGDPTSSDIQPRPTSASGRSPCS